MIAVSIRRVFLKKKKKKGMRRRKYNGMPLMIYVTSCFVAIRNRSRKMHRVSMESDRPILNNGVRSTNVR